MKGSPRRRPDRLGIGDLMTFWAERPSSAWNIAMAGLLDAAPLSGAGGELAVDTVRQEIDGRLDAVPELRRRVLWTGIGQGRPVWTDDPHFDVARHVEVVRLENPLRFPDWAATWAAQPLPRDRPLWRMAFVPGMGRDAVGVALAVHHAVADGVVGAALMARLMDGHAGRGAPSGWRPKSAPTRAALVADAARSRARAIADGLRALPRWPRAARNVRADLAASARAVRGWASDLRLPLPTGSGRRAAMTTWRLADLKAVGHLHGATVNDVVLAAVATGLRRFLGGADVPPLRVSVPVAAPPGARNAGGTLPLVVSLPVGEEDPAVALRAIAAQTAELKASRNRDYPGLTASPLMPVTLARAWTRWLRRHGGRRINLFVTNVPGPTDELRFRGARLRSVYPIAPVVAGVPLAVAVLSYAGSLVLTVNAGTEVTGMEAIVQGADDAFGALRYGTIGCVPGASAARNLSS